ncbi:hypothetical protein R1flu_006980 [Riccia fluitans]|uniref:Uncharacterized protein n=1 Tax=Riccia fluitans TaxID=41844 RepID=A0ABD1YXK6_9MARC
MDRTITTGNFSTKFIHLQILDGKVIDISSFPFCCLESFFQFMGTLARKRLKAWWTGAFRFRPSWVRDLRISSPTAW